MHCTTWTSRYASTCHLVFHLLCFFFYYAFSPLGHVYACFGGCFMFLSLFFHPQDAFMCILGFYFIIFIFIILLTPPRHIYMCLRGLFVFFFFFLPLGHIKACLRGYHIWFYSIVLQSLIIPIYSAFCSATLCSFTLFLLYFSTYDFLTVPLYSAFLFYSTTLFCIFYLCYFNISSLLLAFPSHLTKLTSHLSWLNICLGSLSFLFYFLFFIFFHPQDTFMHVSGVHSVFCSYFLLSFNPRTHSHVSWWFIYFIYLNLFFLSPLGHIYVCLRSLFCLFVPFFIFFHPQDTFTCVPGVYSILYLFYISLVIYISLCSTCNVYKMKCSIIFILTLCSFIFNVLKYIRHTYVTHKAKERAGLCCCLRDWPWNDLINFRAVCLNALLRNVVAEEIDLPAEQPCLLRVNIELDLLQHFKNLLQVCYLCLQVQGPDDYIIKVNVANTS